MVTARYSLCMYIYMYVCVYVCMAMLVKQITNIDW